MSARDRILLRIREQTGTMPPLESPILPEVWPNIDAGRERLVERFSAELGAVDGRTVVCASPDQARHKMGKIVHEQQWQQIGVMDRPGCRDLVSGLGTDRVVFERPGWNPKQMAELSAGVIEADFLLADTGSCVVGCDSSEQRLLCFLPPVCLVAARAGQLFEHMPAAWKHICRCVSEPGRRGEHVIITGPSRTADIEKKLVLGVHGPRKLIVFLVVPDGGQ